MVRTLKISSFVFALTLAQAWGATPETIAKRDQFLQKMGFEDITAQIEATLKSKTKFDGPNSKEILKKSKERYEVINLARSLAVQIYNAFEDRMAKAVDSNERREIKASFYKLVVDLIEIAPQGVEGPLPANLKDDGEGVLAKRAQYVASTLIQQIHVQAEDLASDILSLELGSEKLKEVMNPGALLLEETRKTFEAAAKTHSKIAKYLEIINTDTTIGFSRYLGSALTLLAVRESRLAKTPLERVLGSKLAKSGIEIDNFTSDSIKLRNDKGEVSKVYIPDGAMVAQYATGRSNQEVVQMAKIQDAEPTTMLSSATKMFKDFGSSAWMYGRSLIGGKVIESKASKISSDNDYNNIETSKDFEQELADMDPENNQGYAHAGIAFVYKDTETKLSRVEVRDVFPDKNYGGVRKIGIEAFAMAGPHFRLGVGIIDNKKFAAIVLEQIQRLKIEPKILKRVEIKARGEIAETNLTGEVKSMTNTKELMRLRHIAQNAPDMLYPIVLKRVKEVWNQFLTQDGLGYAYHMAPAMGHYDSVYAIQMSFFISYGLNPHPLAAEYNKEYVAAAANDTASYSAYKSTRLDLTTAQTLMKQPIYSFIQNVEFPVMAYSDRVIAPFQSYGSSDANSEFKALLAAQEKHFTDESVADLTKKIKQELDTKALRVGNLVFVKDVPNAPFLASKAPQGKTPDGNLPDVKALVSSSHRTVSLIEQMQNGDFNKEALELDAFLSQLGFKDLVPTMNPNDGVNEINKRTIKVNIERWAIINSARELTKKIMLLAGPQLKENPEMRRRFLNYVSSLMVLAPPMPTSHFSGEVKNMKDAEARFKAVQDQLVKTAFVDSRKRQVSLVSNLLHMLFTANEADLILNGQLPGKDSLLKETVEIGKLFSTYLQRTMLDTQVGYTYWLGRAMVLAVKRQAIQTDDQSLFDELRTVAAKSHIEIDNYTGNQFSLVTDSDGRHRTLYVETGDLVYERSETWDSVMILVGAGQDKSKLGSVKGQGLDGAAWQVAFFEDNDELINGASAKQRQKKLLGRAEHLNRGFSHVGMAVVFEADVKDPSGKSHSVKSTLIFDNYPYPGDFNRGGVRFLGVEHFANPIETTSFGIGTYDGEKLYQEAKKQFAERKAKGRILPTGKEIWTSIKPNVDPTKPDEDMFIPTRYGKESETGWDPVISEKEYLALMSSPDSASFLKEWRKRITLGAEDLVRRGMYFNWMNDGAGGVKVKDVKTGKEVEMVVSGQSYEGGAYCSLTLYLNSFMYTGVNIEPVEGGYGSIALNAADISAKLGNLIDPIETMGVRKSKELGGGYSRILAPMSLAAQNFVTVNERVQHEVKSYTQTFEASNLPNASVENPKIALSLIKTPEYRSSLGDLMPSQVLREHELENLGHHLLSLSAVQSAMRGGKLTIRAGGKLEAAHE